MKAGLIKINGRSDEWIFIK